MSNKIAQARRLQQLRDVEKEEEIQPVRELLAFPGGEKLRAELERRMLRAMEAILGHQPERYASDREAYVALLRERERYACYASLLTYLTGRAALGTLAESMNAAELPEESEES